MDTILPTKYVFNTNNVLTPTKMQVNWIDKMQHWVPYAILIGFLFSLALASFVAVADAAPEGDLILGAIFYSVAGVFIIMAVCDRPNTPNHQLYVINCEFRLSKNSNLIVKQNKDKYPYYENETRHHPYRLYVKNAANPNKLIYLG